MRPWTMAVRLKKELEVCALSRKLVRMGGGNFQAFRAVCSDPARHLEFLRTELRMAAALARLADIESSLGNQEAADRAFNSAQHIYEAMEQSVAGLGFAGAAIREALDLALRKLRIAAQ